MPHVSANSAATPGFVLIGSRIFNLDMSTESRRLKTTGGRDGAACADLRKAEGGGIHTRPGRREAIVFVLMGEDRWLRQQHVHLGVDAGESPRDVSVP